MLALKPNLLLLDEPASGISQKETEALGPLLLRIREQTGATILMIEHDMPLIMSLSDWVYCLDAGAEPERGHDRRGAVDPAVIEAYLGTPAEQRKVAAQAKKREDTKREVLLEVEGSTSSTTPCRCSTGSTCTCARASASPCSAPTAPASRPC